MLYKDESVVPPEELHPSVKDSILLPQDVRDYISDSLENNHLLDGVEFTDKRIYLAMRMAVSDFNALPPRSQVKASDFPSMALLMFGVLYHLFTGQVAMTARNQMSYSDGGLNIPIEERYEYYSRLAAVYQEAWMRGAENTKITNNLENGWGVVHSDYATFPNW